MASWETFAADAPDLAEAVRERFEAHTNKVLATLRRDGWPRVSGIEATIDAGQLWLAGIWGSVKFADLRRDPRMALHSGTEDPAEQQVAGRAFDAKVSGYAREITNPEELQRFSGADLNDRFHLFRVDVLEAAVVRLGDPADHLVIESWREGVGQKSTKRY
jgi:Pyridoxamine 5'-phosphate oxidase